MKLIENAKQLVILTLLTLVLIALGYYQFFYKPDQLKQTVRDQSSAISVVQKSNENLVTGIQFVKDSEEVKEAVVRKGEELKEQNAAENTKAQAKVETKIDSIKDDFAKQIEKSVTPEKTTALIVAREKAISKTRIDALWANYCRSEPTDPDCRGLK